MALNLSGFILLGLLLFIGFFAGRGADRIGLPRVVGYILTGALFSKELLGFYLTFPNQPTSHWSPEIVTQLALGVIAFLVGAELETNKIRKLGSRVVFGALGQALFCIAFIVGGIWLYRSLGSGSFDIDLALVLGTIAAASAPAATMAVIEEYEAKGDLTTTVLGIVAIDDALTIILFTFALGLAGTESLGASIGEAGLEVGGSILVGALLGCLLGLIGKKIRNEDFRLIPILAMVILSMGLASFLNLSFLLTVMVLGFVSKLVSAAGKEEWHKPLSHIEETIFLIFFTVAGSEFVLHVFWDSLGLILSYIIFRIAGKYTGAWIGAGLAGATKDTRRNLGLALLPHAGVAVGLALVAKATPGLQEYGQLLLNTILGATLFFAIAAPLSTRWALKNAGDIEEQPQKNC